MIKILRGLLAALVAAAFAFALTGSSAQAAPVGGVNQSRACTDGGGVLYQARLHWNYRYTDHAGNERASVDPLQFGTSEDTDGAAIDNRVRVYSWHDSDSALHKIQDRIHFEGEDGNDSPLVADVSMNPKNPLDFVGKSKVTLVIGTDGDGKGNCKVEFLEPEGLIFKGVI